MMLDIDPSIVILLIISITIIILGKSLIKTIKKNENK